MGRPAKILLSPQEMELVNNTDWILTKHIITKKVFEMFGDLSRIISEEIKPYHYLFPENIKHQSGKISKGENYQLLPYVMLDYPSFFWKNRVFAVRTMFWWGNFFSVTLHLSGEHKEKYFSNSADAFLFLQKNSFFICVNDDEWQHHFKDDNYFFAKDISLEQFEKINEKKFCKISKKIPLIKWNDAEEFIIHSFREIMEFLSLNYPGGKKDLSPVFPKAGSGP